MNKSCKGIVGELKVALKYMEKGYWVAASIDPQCPFDLVVVDSKGNIKLIDAKSVSRRLTGKYKGSKINRKLNDKQKKMKVVIEYVNTTTII